MEKFELGPLQKTWIKALRSEEYQQGSGRLYNEITDTYCCLGVANKACNLKETNDACLLDTFSKLGLTSYSGHISENYTRHTLLTTMNDSGDFTFNDIADFIEQNPELIFNESR